MRRFSLPLMLLCSLALACPVKQGRMAAGLLPQTPLLKPMCTPEARATAQALTRPPSRVEYAEFYTLKDRRKLQLLTRTLKGQLLGKGYLLVEDHTDPYGLGLVFENKTTTLLVTSTLEQGQHQVRIHAGPLDRTLPGRR